MSLTVLQTVIKFRQGKSLKVNSKKKKLINSVYQSRRGVESSIPPTYHRFDKNEIIYIYIWLSMAVTLLCCIIVDCLELVDGASIDSASTESKSLLISSISKELTRV